MPKKSRTPDPPRRPVQAPKVRPGVTRTPEEARKFRILLLAGASGLAALTVVIGIILASSGGSSKVNDAGLATTLAKAGCTLKAYKSPPHAADHSDVPTLQARVHWNSFPPSNGAHYARPAVWGYYEEPVNPRLVVHNQEHGGVIIWWGNRVPAATIDELRRFYQSSPDSMFGTPLPGLGDKVALTAWTGDPNRYFRNGYYGDGHVAVCPRFDKKAFTVFRDAYRGKGPEGIPESFNKPGT